MIESKPTSFLQCTGSPQELSLGTKERKQRRRAKKTQSEGVAFMRSSLPDEMPNLPRPTLSPVRENDPESKLETLSELVQMSTKVCYIP